MILYFLIISTAILFYVVIPGLGAFSVRKRWRVFRASLLESLAFPLYRSGNEAPGPGAHRYFGTLEAIEGNDRLWLQHEHSSVLVDTRGARVYVLPSESALDPKALTDSAVQILRWGQEGVFTEGMGAFVFGEVSMVGDLPLFSASDKRALILVFFDGPADRFLSRSIWFGRQRNEYWNAFTPVSLLTGFVVLLSLAFLGFDDARNLYMGRLAGRLASSLSLLPFLPLMPPGIFLFLWYRSLWRKGRTIRARRDLIALGPILRDSRYIAELCGYDAESVDFESAKKKLQEKGGGEAGGTTVIPLVDGRPEASRQDAPATLYRPALHSDPMAESFLIEGDPPARIRAALFGIRWRESLSLVIFGAGLAINFYIVIVLITQILNSV